MRLTLRHFGPVLLIIVLGVGCRSSQTAYKLFTTDEGRFQAEFLSLPKREAVSVTSQGTALSLIAFTSETPTEAVSVSFVDYPNQIPDANRRAVLNGAATGAASTLGGTLQSNQPTSYLGNDAVDFVVSSSSGRVTARAFLAGNRMYILQVVQTQAREESKNYDRLLSTFKVFPGPTPTPSPGAAATASPEATVSMPTEETPAPSPMATTGTSPAGESTRVSPSLEFPYPQKP